MIDFEKPLEGVRANGLKSHQDYEELISVWQNKHKELKTRFADSEKNLERSDLSLKLSRQDTDFLESKNQMLQGQINQRRSCNRCRNCRNCQLNTSPISCNRDGLQIYQKNIPVICLRLNADSNQQIVLCRFLSFLTKYFYILFAGFKLASLITPWLQLRTQPRPVMKPGSKSVPTSPLSLVQGRS